MTEGGYRLSSTILGSFSAADARPPKLELANCFLSPEVLRADMSLNGRWNVDLYKQEIGYFYFVCFPFAHLQRLDNISQAHVFQCKLITTICLSCLCYFAGKCTILRTDSFITVQKSSHIQSTFFSIFCVRGMHKDVCHMLQV